MLSASAQSTAHTVLLIAALILRTHFVFFGQRQFDLLFSITSHDGQRDPLARIVLPQCFAKRLNINGVRRIDSGNHIIDPQSCFVGRGLADDKREPDSIAIFQIGHRDSDERRGRRDFTRVDANDSNKRIMVRQRGSDPLSNVGGWTGREMYRVQTGCFDSQHR